MFLYICAVEDWNVISTWLGGGLYKATMYLLWETYDWDIIIINTWLGSLYLQCIHWVCERLMTGTYH